MQEQARLAGPPVLRHARPAVVTPWGVTASCHGCLGDVDNNKLTVVGGGLAGLIAAVTGAEAGTQVHLLEAHTSLGGRARSTAPPYVANDGPHVLYGDGTLWSWLVERRLATPYRRLPLAAATAIGFRHQGRLLATYTADPGRLSAAFVWERLLRVSNPAGGPRYLVGGRGALLDRLERYARRLGVRIDCGTPVTALPDGPVVVATSLPAVRRLLQRELRSPSISGSTALLDVAVQHRRGGRLHRL